MLQGRTAEATGALLGAGLEGGLSDCMVSMAVAVVGSMVEVPEFIAGAGLPAPSPTVIT